MSIELAINAHPTSSAQPLCTCNIVCYLQQLHLNMGCMYIYQGNIIMYSLPDMDSMLLVVRR